MKLKLSKAKKSALGTGLRAFIALVVYIVLSSLEVPVQFAGSLSILTPIILHAIDPNFKDYGKGKVKP